MVVGELYKEASKNGSSDSGKWGLNALPCSAGLMPTADGVPWGTRLRLARDSLGPTQFASTGAVEIIYTVPLQDSSWHAIKIIRH
jgi:hypothetical protein